MIKKNTISINTKKMIANIERVTGDTVNRVLITGLSYAASVTPRDTSNLINSQFKTISETKGGAIGQAGYRATYALSVHSKTSEILRGQPRPRAGAGNYWNPDAESEFLLKGFERDGKEEIEYIIKEAYKVKNANR